MCLFTVLRCIVFLKVNRNQYNKKFLDCYTGDSKDIELYHVFAAEIFSEVLSTIPPVVDLVTLIICMLMHCMLVK